MGKSFERGRSTEPRNVKHKKEGRKCGKPLYLTSELLNGTQTAGIVGEMTHEIQKTKGGIKEGYLQKMQKGGVPLSS